MKIHHVGFLTKRLNKTEAEFLALGYQVERPAEYDSIRRINIEFMRNGEYCVELIEPADADSPMYPLLKNYKNTPYHFCYETGDLTESIALLEQRGYRVIDAPEHAPCIDDRRVTFLLHSHMGIVELVETAVTRKGSLK